jgi:hypothetical protein
MHAGLPATSYRPAVVVGDSTTGATQKYDGPYFVIQWLLRQPRVAIMPVVGDPKRTRFNVVPRGFVVDAIAWLRGRADSEGAVLALASPDAPPPSAVDYFILPTTFGTEGAQRALAGSGIACPPFEQYAERLVDFARRHPEVGSHAMT